MRSPFDPSRLAKLDRRAARLGGALRWVPRGDGGLLSLALPGHTVARSDIDDLAARLRELEQSAGLSRMCRKPSDVPL